MTNKRENIDQSYSFWDWFFYGVGDKRGFKNLISPALAAHVIIGVILSFVIHQPLSSVATAVILPLAGVLVGLTFAWGGNAQALLQTNEILKLADKVSGGIREHACYYQLSILLVLITIVGWGLVGIGAFELLSQNLTFFIRQFFRAFAFAFTSLTFHECWHVVDSARQLLIARYDINMSELRKDDE